MKCPELAHVDTTMYNHCGDDCTTHCEFTKEKIKLYNSHSEMYDI